jgi:polar amino acid transport system substrate-binding protein
MGAYYNRTMQESYLLNLERFSGTRDAKLALADRRCVGWLYDEPALVQTLQDPAWSDYGLPLKPVLVVPWGIAVRRGPETASLARLIGDLVAGWHRDGTLIDLERKWGLPASAFLAREHELWQRRDGSGAYLCTRRADGEWPAECRNPAFVTARETSGLTAVGLALRQRTGLDVTILYDPFERALFLRGVLVTLGLILASAGGSILFGILAAAAVDARVPLLSRAVLGFTTFARMTPPLLQIYVIFFGVGGLLVSRLGFGLDAFGVAALCLAVYAGSANVAAFLDAAAVLRLREPEARVGPHTLGPLFRLAYPAVMANTVNVIKATGMASAVAVPEIINASTSILAEHGNSAVMMNLLMVVYFLLVFGAVRALSAVERRVGARVAR